MKHNFFMVIFFIIYARCLFAEMPDSEIPHYKLYPRTAIIDYKNDVLDFYSVKYNYGEFSNFALFPVFIDGLLWPSSEHYYQSQKFLDNKLQEQIRLAPTPYLAAEMARDPKMPLRDDWDEVKEKYMLKALHAKFSQYRQLRELLLSTNSAHLYEHTANDCYWADCGDRTGKNVLGEELMMIRNEILDEK